VNPGELP